MTGIPEPARPTPHKRRSAFAAAGPSQVATPSAVAPVAQPAPPVADARGRKRKAATTDILLSLPVEMKDRMVATLEHTRPRTGITSQQQFIRTAIEQLCGRLEAEFNESQPFPQPAQEINI